MSRARQVATAQWKLAVFTTDCKLAGSAEWIFLHQKGQGTCTRDSTFVQALSRLLYKLAVWKHCYSPVSSAIVRKPYQGKSETKYSGNSVSQCFGCGTMEYKGSVQQ